MIETTFSPWAVLGAGAWGTALAVHLASKPSNPGYLVARRGDLVVDLNLARENTTYLPGVPLSQAIAITTLDDLPWAEIKVFFIAYPTKGLNDLMTVLHPLQERLSPGVVFIVLSKGIEPLTRLTPVSFVARYLPDHICGVLSGPNNALQVALVKPTAAVLSFNKAYPEAKAFQSWLSSPALRVYHSQDVQGVELGGCLKNVYAVGAGIIDALQLGDNAKAAYLTRVLQEMTRLGIALGGSKETFLGLSGIGDLMATCYGAWSRNRTFGEAIGKGKRPEDLIAQAKSVIEGYASTKNFFELSCHHAVNCPVLTAIYQVLYHHKAPLSAIDELMQRDLKGEN